MQFDDKDIFQKYHLPDFTHIPEGFFYMGNNEGPDDEKPERQIFVKSFYMAITAVTRSAYSVFMTSTQRIPPPFWTDPKFMHPNQPVVGVNWNDASEYCFWLSQETGFHFRLPTEAEREKACRGGSIQTKYSWGNKLPENYSGGRHAELSLAQSGNPNGFGLYNMCEGVHEWCSDWYITHDTESPLSPKNQKRKSARGGSWRHEIRFTRCSARSSLPPELHYSDFGFRIVLSLDPGDLRESGLFETK